MKSIPVAITWETLRKGNWNFLGGFLGGNLIPILIFGIFRRQGVDFHDPSLVMIHSTFFLVNWCVFFGVALSASGSPSRLYHLPISTSTLVASHLFPTMAIVALEMFLSLVLQNALFDLQLPLWSPLLFSTTAIALFLATLWFTEKSAWMPIAEAVVFGVLGVWFHCRFSRPEHPLNRLWIASIPGELLILFVALLVSYFVSLNGMARNRCGEQLKPWGFLAWISRILDGASQESPPFRSAAEAQAWYEWRLKGWMFPITVIFELAIGFAIWVSLIRDPQHLIGGLLGIGMMMPMISMVWAIVIGNVGPMDSNFEMRSFLASRPMTSKHMARTILMMTAKSVLLSWSLWLGSLLIVIVLLRVTGTTPQPLFPQDFNWILFPATLLGSWTVVSVWSTAYIAGTIWCFVAAYRQNMIESHLIVAACGVWFMLSTVAIATWVQYPITPAVNCALFVGLAALVVVPVAAAPLALAWNRTR